MAMLMHSAKKHRARNIKATERPVTLAKPEELLTGLALMLHNGLNRRGRQHPCFLQGSKIELTEKITDYPSKKLIIQLQINPNFKLTTKIFFPMRYH